MKTLWKAGVLLLVIASPSMETVGIVSAASRPGSESPEFSLQNLDGKRVALSSFRGKVVFLDFWATWCPPCRMSTPAVVQMNSKFKGKNLAVIGINLDDSIAPVRSFVKRERIEHLILFSGDSPVERDYRIRSIPTFFILDRDGVIVRRYDGYYPGMERDWVSVINLLLSSK